MSGQHKDAYFFCFAQNYTAQNINSLISTGELRKGQRYDLDFDHQFIATEKYEAIKKIPDKVSIGQLKK